MLLKVPEFGKIVDLSAANFERYGFTKVYGEIFEIRTVHDRIVRTVCCAEERNQTTTIHNKQPVSEQLQALQGPCFPRIPRTILPGNNKEFRKP